MNSIAIKERPILFSALMVRAILDGRKTQTRRELQNQPTVIRDPFPTTEDVKNVFLFKESTGIYKCLGMKNLIDTCKFGKSGDRLWVRESWSTHAVFNDKKPSDLRTVNSYHYLADGAVQTGKKRPSIHMPRWASRIDLEITSVRVERLQEISEQDALAEGMTSSFIRSGDTRVGGSSKLYGIDQDNTFALTAKSAYEVLWEQINGQGSWDKNPWVWVIEFKRVDAGVSA